MSESVKVSFLGRFQMEIGGETVAANMKNSWKMWSVLCFLITHRHRRVSQQELIEQFWADESVTNPNNALKTLIHRIRATLGSLYPPRGGLKQNGGSVILFEQDGYVWNPAIACETDVEQFENLYIRASESGRTVSQRIELYRQALELYQGDFLPMFSGQMWVTVLSAYYHTLYIEAVKSCAYLLERAGDYTGVVTLCAHASELDPFEEGFHVAILRAYLHQGQYELAADHYRKVAQMYQDNLGAEPSEELQALGLEVMSGKKANALGLEALLADLREANEGGTFVCDYTFFRRLYQLEVRRMTRYEPRVHVAVITMEAAEDVLPSAMEDFLDVLRENLRCGDVISRYAEGQVVALLANADADGGEFAMKRTAAAFHRFYPHYQAKLTYQLEEIKMEQESKNERKPQR